MSEPQRGTLVHASYRVRDGAPVVQLFGRLESGAAFHVEDGRSRPYFFVPVGQERALAGVPGVTLTACPLRDLAGRPVLRVETRLPGDVPGLRGRLRDAGGEALEADVPFATRYLLDRGLASGLAIRGEARAVRPGLLHFRDPELEAAAVDAPLRSLSLDLETTPDASRLLSAALVGEGREEVHLVARGAVAGATSHADERALLVALVERFRELDPDVLLGWNLVDFDLRVLFARCEANGVAPRFGRSDDAARVLPDAGPRRMARAELPGRVALDGLPLVREALRLPDYRLETVARAVLRRGKKIDAEAPDAAAEILRMYREDPEALVAYNLEDARLVPEILAAEGLLALAIERSRLTGMPLDRVGASIASFDRVVLPELRARGRVAPCADPERKAAAVRGGAVLEPRPGLHRDVAVLDFKSLYPSLIRTFRLDPLAHACAGADAIVAPNGARFDRREAILPDVIERFAARRAAARARGDPHADQAIKIMMNALFGVLGAASCRFFDADIANAITGFGQQVLGWTREAFEGMGVPVLYGDTDSVFVQLPATRDAAERRAAALRLRAAAEASVVERIRRDHALEPSLELELDVIYERLLLPRVRGGEGGSRKRYAGRLEGGELAVVGLEAVRRDWPALAHRLQEGMLRRLFADEDPAPLVRELVARLRAGELDAELVTVKRVRKGDLSRYAANAPHVQAARKAGRLPGGVVRYVITTSGPEPCLPGRPLPAGIDRGHYVEKVVRPVAEAILREIGGSFDEALGAPRQLSLL